MLYKMLYDNHATIIRLNRMVVHWRKPTVAACGVYPLLLFLLFTAEHMDGESGLVIGHSQRERKRTYRDFLLDVGHGEESDSSDQEFSGGVTHKVRVGFSNTPYVHLFWCCTFCLLLIMVTMNTLLAAFLRNQRPRKTRWGNSAVRNPFWTLSPILCGKKSDPILSGLVGACMAMWRFSWCTCLPSMKKIQGF